MIWEYVDQQMLPVQYFERGRLEHHPLQAGHADEVQISALGKELAQLRNLPTAPVPAATTLEVATVAEAMHPDVLAQSIGPEVTEADSAATDGSLPDLAEAEAATASEPLAAASAAVIDTSDSTTAAEEWVEPYQQPSPLWSSGGNKHIEISIGGQWLYAYEDGLLVFDAPISTGRDGFNTPMGSYSIYAKVPVETMSGTLGGEYYYVPNVPSVMYINGGVAMHGTYWHSQFGTGVRMSHGCVNLPMASASWLYGWAPVGTPVLVY
ncbi:MAG: L,D-transpeptidase [Chloroflexaceae bacterium]|nr:L,D-transpeptidase [Chloroflexaceae bacterium]